MSLVHNAGTRRKARVRSSDTANSLPVAARCSATIFPFDLFSSISVVPHSVPTYVPTYVRTCTHIPQRARIARNSPSTRNRRVCGYISIVIETAGYSPWRFSSAVCPRSFACSFADSLKRSCSLYLPYEGTRTRRGDLIPIERNIKRLLLPTFLAIERANLSGNTYYQKSFYSTFLANEYRRLIYETGAILRERTDLLFFSYISTCSV